MAKTKRVAIYARVSTDGQTTENQLRELRAAVERNGWLIVGEYVDHGISGAKGRRVRPQFDALLRGVTRKEFDVVADGGAVGVTCGTGRCGCERASSSGADGIPSTGATSGVLLRLRRSPAARAAPAAKASREVPGISWPPAAHDRARRRDRSRFGERYRLADRWCSLRARGPGSPASRARGRVGPRGGGR